MAKAPDPKQVAAELARENAAKAREEMRKARRRMVLWLWLDDDRRVLRLADVSAVQEQRLADVGVDVIRLFRSLALTSDRTEIPLRDMLAGWWLAGMQAGVDGETWESLQPVTLDAAPYVLFPSDEELATDEGADVGPLG